MTSVLDSLDNLEALILELETLLTPYIGTFSNGQIALWAEPPFIPPTLDCSGLQVVVGRWTEDLQPQKACVGSAQAVQRKFWRVTLIGFDLSEEGLSKMDSAIAVIERRFPIHRMRSPATKEDAYPQVTFLLDVSRIINLSL
jgi:hypothetical protein